LLKWEQKQKLLAVQKQLMAIFKTSTFQLALVLTPQQKYTPKLLEIFAQMLFLLKSTTIS